MRTVSIPKRVSEALNPTYVRTWQGSIPVSIPKRVSEALNRIIIFINLKLPTVFQSLKGFQRLWIKADNIYGRILGCVSIPKRVSEALNLWYIQSAIAFKAVSIPKRVSEALNLLILNVIRMFIVWFQSLKGFQRLWIICKPKSMKRSPWKRFNP